MHKFRSLYTVSIVIETKVAWLVDLNYNFEFDWFVELSDNKLSDNKLSNNNLAGKVEKTDPDLRTTHWPRSADYPTDYSTDYPK